MAQRKRFTRVEMARVLMERNQYKGMYKKSIESLSFRLPVSCYVYFRFVIRISDQSNFDHDKGSQKIEKNCEIDGHFFLQSVLWNYKRLYDGQK